MASELGHIHDLFAGVLDADFAYDLARMNLPDVTVDPRPSGGAAHSLNPQKAQRDGGCGPASRPSGDGTELVAAPEPHRIAAKALEAGIQEAYVQGLSPQSIKEHLRRLGPAAWIPEDDLGRLCGAVDGTIAAFLDRPIAGEWPYLWLLSAPLRVGSGGSVAAARAIFAAAVAGDGRREVLGLQIGLGSSPDPDPVQAELVFSLERRGLLGVGSMISSACESGPDGGVLAALRLPDYPPQLAHTAQLVAQLGETIRRRLRSVDAFAGEWSAFRFIGAALIEHNDAWAAKRARFAAPEPMQNAKVAESAEPPVSGAPPRRPATRAIRSLECTDPPSSRATWEMPEAPGQSAQLWYENKRLAQEEYANGVSVVTARPVWISFDTGSVCNLRCVQCPREQPGIPFVEQKADRKVAKRVFQAFPYLERLTLYGLGEPMLSSVFWDIVENPDTKKIPHLDINTNGTLLSARNVDRILKSNLNFLKISIDGATEQTYNRIRGGKLAKVLAGVRRLTSRRQELGRDDFKVWLSMTLMLENIRELPMMVDLGCDLGTDALWAQHLVMKGDGSQDTWRITHDSWTFDYNDQYLGNAPALSNQMVRLAKKRADRRGYNFELDAELWLSE